jgi:hypothetical protein
MACYVSHDVLRVGDPEADSGEVVFGGIDDMTYTGHIAYVSVRLKAHWEGALGDDELISGHGRRCYSHW